MTRKQESTEEVKYYAKLFVEPGCIWVTDGALGYKWLANDLDYCVEHKFVIHNIEFKEVDHYVWVD